MSDVLWSIDARNDYAGNLTDRMREHAEQMLHALDIDVEFDFTETQQQQVLNPDTRQQLYLIFKEAVNNLAKYSQARNAIISVKADTQKIELLIKDDGRGFDMATVKNGNGLQNMAQRAAASRAALSIVSKPGNGTVVALEMKVN